MALIMSIEMDQEGIIEAIRIEASKSVATPEGKVMVVELNAVRKPAPGYAASITFEDIETAGAKLPEVKEQPTKRTTTKAAKKVVEKVVETVEPQTEDDSEEDDSEGDEGGDPDDREVADLDLGEGDDDNDCELPEQTKPFDLDGTEDSDDVFD